MQKWLEEKIRKAAKEKQAAEDKAARERQEELDREKARLAKERAEKLAEQVRRAVESKKLSLSLRRNQKDQSSGSVERAQDSSRHLDEYQTKHVQAAVNRPKKNLITPPEHSQRSRAASGAESEHNLST